MKDQDSTSVFVSHSVPGRELLTGHQAKCTVSSSYSHSQIQHMVKVWLLSHWLMVEFLTSASRTCEQMQFNQCMYLRMSHQPNLHRRASERIRSDWELCPSISLHAKLHHLHISHKLHCHLCTSLMSPLNHRCLPFCKICHQNFKAEQDGFENTLTGDTCVLLLWC